MIHHRKTLVATVGLGGAAAFTTVLIVGPAIATPPTGGFSPSTIFVGEFDPFDVKAEKTDKWDLALKSKGVTDLRVNRVSFPAHSSSGWHSHPGPNLLTVTIGEVVEYEGDNPLCTPTVYHTGDTFGDNGGSAVHLVRNETGVAAEVMAVALYPHGVTPLTTSQPKPTNCGEDIL
jgi:quercetin dioxygenase-like cupin family protein